MNDRTAVIFTGGEGPKRAVIEDIVNSADITLAADSGWDLAVELGFEPDYFIGDMDSLTDKSAVGALPDERKFLFPVDKDYTDTELALKHLEELGYSDIVLIGGGGGRMDHMLALCAVFGNETRPERWFTANEQIVYLAGERSFESRAGQHVSIFAAGGREAVVDTDGLRWNLNDHRLSADFFSLSNRSLGDRFRINVKKGAVLTVLNY